MALYHHSSNEYGVSASNAAANARNILEGLIETGQQKALNVIEAIHSQVPDDYVVAGSKLNFLNDNSEIALQFGDQQRVLHPHALGHCATRGNVPVRFVRDLYKLNQEGNTWAGDLAAHTLNEVYANDSKPRRFLARGVNENWLSLMSDKYRRLDSRPIFDAFAKACQGVGAVPINGHALLTKNALQGVLPHVFEPVENEVLSIGLCLQNSDHGNGALSIKLFMLRLWCTNYAIANECLRNIHIGGRLAENIEFSQKTYMLDTAATVSAVNDIVKDALSPAKVNAMCDAVRAANEAGIEHGAMKAFLKAHVNKGEAEEITQVFKSNDVYNLPKGESVWRLSNAISWIAGNTADEARSFELQQVAGNVVSKYANFESTAPAVAEAPVVNAAPVREDQNGRFVGLEID